MHSSFKFAWFKVVLLFFCCAHLVIICTSFAGYSSVKPELVAFVIPRMNIFVILCICTFKFAWFKVCSFAVFFAHIWSLFVHHLRATQYQSMTFWFQNFSVSKLLHFLDGFGFGIERIWYRKKYRIRYWKYLVSEKSFGFGFVQIFGIVTHCSVLSIAWAGRICHSSHQRPRQLPHLIPPL